MTSTWLQLLFHSTFFAGGLKLDTEASEIFYI